MLWYKGWLETRFRLLFLLVVQGSFLIFVLWTGANAQVREPIRAVGAFISFTIPTFVVMICGMLGGAGIATQPSFQAVRGLHGSTLFTVSLPVSRLRLLAVRASLGWLEMAAAIGALCCGIWLVFPALRAMANASEMFQYAAILIACGSAIYSISVLAGTFLDDLWRTWGTVIGALALWGLTRHAPLRTSIGIFPAMGDRSVVMTHTMPWGAMLFSLGLAAILLFAALKVVQSREY